METSRQSGDKLPPARGVGDLRLHARDRVGSRVNRPDEPTGFQPFGGSPQLGPDGGIVCLQAGAVLLNPRRQRCGVPLTVGPFDPNRRQTALDERTTGLPCAEQERPENKPKHGLDR